MLVRYMKCCEVKLQASKTSFAYLFIHQIKHKVVFSRAKRVTLNLNILEIKQIPASDVFCRRVNFWDLSSGKFLATVETRHEFTTSSFCMYELSHFCLSMEVSSLLFSLKAALSATTRFLFAIPAPGDDHSAGHAPSTLQTENNTVHHCLNGRVNFSPFKFDCLLIS